MGNGAGVKAAANTEEADSTRCKSSSRSFPRFPSLTTSCVRDRKQDYARPTDPRPDENLPKTVEFRPSLQESGLSARRVAQGRMSNNLTVNVAAKTTRKAVIDQLQAAADCSHGQSRKIVKTDCFRKMYDLGAEVIPSVHSGIEVRHGSSVQDKTRVIIKVRRKRQSFANPQEEQSWKRGAEFMLNLPHSSTIAQIFGIWEDQDCYYVVMERVGGSDLFELLDFTGMLPLHESKAILKQIIIGINVLHSRGCIHKDLKLENVMVNRPKSSLSEEPTVKLIDFDTAECWEPRSPKSKMVLGTDQYISSEAYTGKYSPASDMFAFGVIAYKLITGQFPFSDKMFDDEAGENWVGSPKMKQIQERVEKARINYSIAPFPSVPEAVKFVKLLLTPKEQHRMNAEQALAHPFLADCMSPIGSTTAGSPTRTPPHSPGLSTSRSTSPKWFAR